MVAGKTLLNTSTQFNPGVVVHLINIHGLLNAGISIIEAPRPSLHLTDRRSGDRTVKSSLSTGSKNKNRNNRRKGYSSSYFPSVFILLCSDVLLGRTKLNEILSGNRKFLNVNLTTAACGQDTAVSAFRNKIPGFSEV